MDEFNLVKTITICTQKKRFAILKVLLTEKKMTYSDINKNTGNEDLSKFGYHMRTMVRYKLIQKNLNGYTYSITGRGKEIIDLLHNMLKNRYISEDSAGMCTNDDNGNHSFIIICTKCSYIKEKNVPDN